MKQFCFILLSVLLVHINVYAQGNSVIDDLNSTKPGQGSVRVYEDESISGLIGSRISTQGMEAQNEFDNISNSSPNISDPVTEITPSKSNLSTTYIQTKGYRIQVFSGNDQRNSKKEAQNKKSMIEGAFPEVEVVVSFNSPVWRVRAGNFRTYEQAFETLNQMKKMFPSFGKEMQIVEATIKLPVN